MTTIAVDGLNEEAFRRSIESRLRQGRAGDAVEKLRALLEPYAGEGRILPARFLTIQSSDLALSGWEQLGDVIVRNDRDGWPITALSIAFGWPGEVLPLPDERGLLRPLVETSYFTDEAYPFSQSRRDDLLEGYSYHGCTWAADCAATDTVLTLEGIDDLHGALAALEADLLASETPDEEAIRAGSLGACLLSALLFQAVDARIKQDGLPRPLCVLAGSNGVYPYFDAPVSGMSEDALKAAEAAEEEETVANYAVPGPRYSSLLVTGIPRARKRAVLVLEESAEQTAQRTADLLQSNQAVAAAPGDDMGAQPPSPDLTGAGITPVAGGPLMAKKKPSEPWDFRDLLSSRDSDPPDTITAPATELPSAELPQPEQEQPEADWSRTDPIVDEQRASEISIDAPVPFVPADPTFNHSTPCSQPISVPTPAPGFDLLDESVQTRLESLMTRASPLKVAEAEIKPVEPVFEQSEEPATKAELEAPEGPVWCFGIGYLEKAEEDAAMWQGVIEWAEPTGPGLWSRLRTWLKRGR